jgi:hypothetical protein
VGFSENIAAEMRKIKIKINIFFTKTPSFKGTELKKIIYLPLYLISR